MMSVLFRSLLLAGAVASPLFAQAPLPDASSNVESQAESLSLEQAYDQVTDTDQGMRIALTAIRDARLQPWSALAQMGPRVTGNASYFEPQDQTFSSTGPVLVDTKSANITLEQPLLDASVFANYRHGKLATESARKNYRSVARTTLFGVAEAYFEVLKEEKIVEVNRETLVLANDQLELANRRFKVGVVTKSDVLKARVRVEEAGRTVTESENALSLAQTVLANILNETGTVFRVTEPASHAVVTNTLPALLELAYSHREDYQVSQLAVQESVAAHDAVAAGYAPSLVAQWVNEWVDPETSSEPNNFWEATVTLKMPFFEGGQREVDMRRSNLQTATARLQNEQVRKSVDEDVHRAWFAVQTLEQTLVALRAQVAAAEENYQELQNQYKNGTATSLDVYSALDDLNSARKDLTTETYDREIALCGLELATGTFEDERIERMKIP